MAVWVLMLLETRTLKSLNFHLMIDFGHLPAGQNIHQPHRPYKCPFVSAFRSWNTRFEESSTWKCVWFSPKRNFLEKVAFWAKADNELRMCKTYGALEVHKQKVQCAFCSIRWALPSITKLPLIKIPQFSCLSELIPLISSLYSPNKFLNPNTKKSITNSPIS